jgi:hypothetical protein
VVLAGKARNTTGGTSTSSKSPDHCQSVLTVPLIVSKLELDLTISRERAAFDQIPNRRPRSGKVATIDREQHVVPHAALFDLSFGVLIVLAPSPGKAPVWGVAQTPRRRQIAGSALSGRLFRGLPATQVETVKVSDAQNTMPARKDVRGPRRGKRFSTVRM